MTTCDWCGGTLADDEPRANIYLLDEKPGSRIDPTARHTATFHTELPCFSEARDYGWSE